MTYVPAHTNAVGHHFQSDWRTEKSVGSVFDVDLHAMVPLDRVDASYSVLIGESHKPPPYKGDHRTAYDYGRSVSRVIEDEPFLLHSHYVNPVDGLTSNYDYNSSEYISKYRTPFSSSPVKGPLVENALDEAITKALLSLKGKETASNGADLGELGTTIDALAKDATKAANFIRAVRRGQWRTAAGALGLSWQAFKGSRGRNISDFWLNYVYGWRPLAQSMYDNQSAIAEIISRRSDYVEGTGTVILQGDKQDGVYYGRIRESNVWAARCKCVLKATIASKNFYNINKLGLTNPLSVGWEVVPFSFVIDWFLPVGNTLDALSGGFGLDWVGGYFHVTTASENHMWHEPGVITPWVNCSVTGSYRERQFRFQRVALSAFPRPRFYADTTPISMPRAVNALALVRSLT